VNFSRNSKKGEAMGIKEGVVVAKLEPAIGIGDNPMLSMETFTVPPITCVRDY